MARRCNEVEDAEIERGDAVLLVILSFNAPHDRAGRSRTPPGSPDTRDVSRSGSTGLNGRIGSYLNDGDPTALEFRFVEDQLVDHAQTRLS